LPLHRQQFRRCCRNVVRISGAARCQHLVYAQLHVAFTCQPKALPRASTALASGSSSWDHRDRQQRLWQRQRQQTFLLSPHLGIGEPAPIGEHSDASLLRSKGIDAKQSV